MNSFFTISPVAPLSLSNCAERIGSPIGPSSPNSFNPVPEYQEFTKRLPSDKLALVEAKWRELPIEELAHTLVGELKQNPYRAEIFFHEELEFIALYAASKGLLTIFEASNLLLFQSTCATYGRDKVEVHFMVDEEGRRVEEAQDCFLFGAAPLFERNPNRFLLPALQAVELPRHQFVFFSVSEDEAYEPDADDKVTIRQRLSQLPGVPFLQTKVCEEMHRLVMTPELFETYLHKLFPQSQSKIYPVLGEVPFSEFENFSSRAVSIPSSLFQPPERTDTFLTSGRLNFYTHDLYHALLDKVNPHLGAFEELAPILRDYCITPFRPKSALLPFAEALRK